MAHAGHCQWRVRGWTHDHLESAGPGQGAARVVGGRHLLARRPAAGGVAGGQPGLGALRHQRAARPRPLRRRPDGRRGPSRR
ncbi:N-acetylglucosamine-6-phosphate deacetylase [Actinacidiphila bryophytorum]|uniref:N-acetylglucosamine-6-phosphate deacetylase n=1 Tax=Actinacidiphila bryophytorum TaxID=1436133 RepID=A0A9W4GYG9_9ACTN|nr:N-acetylglucosamine-6-phosphate deacetylase [Actinacidiphila bryophytorum]